MSATATPAIQGASGEHSPAGAFASVLNAVVGSAAVRLEQKVDGWADKLNGVAARHDSEGGLSALAGLHGKNPAWAAIKGAWQAGSPVVKASIVAAVAAAGLLLILSPVLLLVFLVSLLIIAAVHRARATKK